MDDGSSEKLDNKVKKWRREANFPIFLFSQENSGKMASINALISKTSGDIIIEMDDDDYFCPHVFSKIVFDYQKILNNDKVYGVIYEKEFSQNNRNIKSGLKGKICTLYDLHYKEKEDFDMALTFKGDYRRKFSYELENGEKFVTEARMYYKMD